MKNFFLFSILLIFSANNHAAWVWHTSTIDSIYPLGTGAVILLLEEDSSGCTSPETKDYYYLAPNQADVTPEAFKNLYSAVLMAAASKKSISFVFDDSESHCYINRLVVNM